MSLVAEYEAKIKEVVTAEIGTEEILNVFWECPIRDIIRNRPNQEEIHV